MKKLLGIVAFSAIACFASAQDSTIKMQDTSMMTMGQLKKDCVEMKDSKMMIVKKGKSMIMDSTFNLNNGGTVMTDGTIKMTDGTTKMLKEGQYIDIDGKIGIVKKPIMLK